MFELKPMERMWMSQLLDGNSIMDGMNNTSFTTWLWSGSHKTSSLMVNTILNSFTNYLSELKLNKCRFFIFIFRLERVKPVCLPFTPDLINQRFVGYSPFVAGWSVIFLV